MFISLLLLSFFFIPAVVTAEEKNDMVTVIFLQGVQYGMSMHSVATHALLGECKEATALHSHLQRSGETYLDPKVVREILQDAYQLLQEECGPK